MSAWLVSARVSDPVTRCEASVAQAGRRQLWVRAVSSTMSQPSLRSRGGVRFYPPRKTSLARGRARRRDPLWPLSSRVVGFVTAHALAKFSRCSTRFPCSCRFFQQPQTALNLPTRNSLVAFCQKRLPFSDSYHQDDYQNGNGACLYDQTRSATKPKLYLASETCSSRGTALGRFNEERRPRTRQLA